MYSQVSFTKKAKVVFDDKTKEDELKKDSERDGQKAEDEFVGSEKDGQKVEVTFEFESEALKKDDQKACEDDSESSEEDDQNNQNPFIVIDWHEWLERILEVSKELPIYKK